MGEVQNEAQEELEAEAAFMAGAGEGEQAIEAIDEPVEPESQEVDYGVPAELVAKIREEAAREAEQKLSGRLRNLEGHLGGLKSKLDMIAAAKATADQSGADSPTARQITEAAKSGTKLAALREDFPEFADALDEVVSGMRPGVDEDRVRAAEQSTADSLSELREMRRLDKAHPDWEDIVQSEEYNNWIYNQPEFIQKAAFESKRSSDAIEVLNKFKAEMTPQNDLTANSRQRDRLEKTTAPTRGNSPIHRHVMSDEEAFLRGAGEWR